MWRETNLFGIFFSPLIVYSLVALVIWLPFRYAVPRLGLHRWMYNVAVAELAVYLCLLAALVTWL